METALYTPDQQISTVMSWELKIDKNGSSSKPRNPHEAAYFSKLLTSWDRIQQLGQQPVTIVNINPFRLMVLSPLFDGLFVEGNKSGEKYSALVIKDVKFQIDEGMDRNWAPVEFWPIQLANEFERQYAEKGGVFILRGDLKKNPELEHTKEFKAAFEKADKQLENYCFRLKRQADNEWNTPNRSGARNIHPPHRLAAQILFDRKRLKKLPDWMQDEVSTEDVQKDCVCGQPTKRGQIACSCGWYLLPGEAFQRQLIDEHHSSLERLTRKEAIALGISDYIAETADERPKRLKDNKPKPLSKFAIEQQKALDAEQKKGKEGK